MFHKQLSSNLPEALVYAQKLLYTPLGWEIHNLKQAQESREYDAFEFMLNEQRIIYRRAKITPTKIGQFVTLWQRDANGITQPYDASDGIDFVIISAQKDQRVGQFVFPASVLRERGVVSQDGKGGKRAIRVYPPWDHPTSQQAKRTQAWQAEYFIAFEADKLVKHFLAIVGPVDNSLL